MKQTTSEEKRQLARFTRARAKEKTVSAFSPAPKQMLNAQRPIPSEVQRENDGREESAPQTHRHTTRGGQAPKPKLYLLAFGRARPLRT